MALATHVPYSATATVRAIDAMHFRGNITPHSWYERLIHPRTGYAYLLAIVALGEFVYRFRGTEIEDTKRPRLVDIGAKFYGPKYEIDYRQYAKKFGCTPRQFRDAVSFLVADGAVLRDIVPVYGIGGKLAGQKILIDLNPERIAYLNEPLGEVGDDFDRDLPSDDMAEDGNIDTPAGDFFGLDRSPCDEVGTPCDAISSHLTENPYSQELNPSSPPLVPAGDRSPARAVGGAAGAAGRGPGGPGGGGGFAGANNREGGQAGAARSAVADPYAGAYDRGEGEAPPHSARPPQTMGREEFGRLLDKEFGIEQWAKLIDLDLDRALVVKALRRKVRNEPGSKGGILYGFVKTVGPTLVADEPSAGALVATRDEPDMPPGPTPPPSCPDWVATPAAVAKWKLLDAKLQRLIAASSTKLKQQKDSTGYWLTGSEAANRALDGEYRGKVAELIRAAGYEAHPPVPSARVAPGPYSLATDVTPPQRKAG